MSLTIKTTADLDTNSTAKSARRARIASSAAAANARNAAQNAALAAQNAASLAQIAAQNAGAISASAAQNASGVAQTAATRVSKGVNQGVYTARSWAAPRLDSAADYCTTTVAPKVSSALHSTARQVNPVDTTITKKRPSVLTWSVLGAAILAAVGAAAAVVRYRYRTAIAADSETADEEVIVDSTDSQAAAPVNPDGTRTRPAAETPTDPVAGPVTASGTAPVMAPGTEPGTASGTASGKGGGKKDQGTESVNGRVASSGW